MEEAAQSIVGMFGQVLLEELQEIRGVGDKVVHLRDELATMNALLRVISEAEQGSVDHLVREWEKQVHDLAYDAEDCIDNYSLCIVRPTPIPSPPPPTDDDIVGSRPTTLTGRLVRRGSRGASLTSYWARYLVARAKWMARYPYEKLVLQRALAADIKDLLARTTIVSERRARYGIDRAALPTSACFVPVSVASISANSLHRADNPDQLVGITEQAKDLANKIKALAHDEDDKSLKAFCIVGFGGLGKTTLAMELCRQLDADFPFQAQVSVSQAFDVQKDMQRLLARVLQQILKKKEDTKANQTNKEEEAQIDKMNVEELSSKPNDEQTNPTTVEEEKQTVENLSIQLKQLLNKTRYLIVIDDVWSLPAWEAIRIRLPENNCCSRIIVTTRIEAVAKATSVYFVHHMKRLGEDFSKELFVRRVFGSMAACPGGLEKYMDTILKKCGGMPLAIISIASLLASYSSAEGTMMWERVSRSIGSQLESHPTLEGMRQLITLSYDYLPHHLKPCMMYLSIFPEDCAIAKKRLLYRWIAEGLVTEKRGLTLLEVAEECFNELVSRNMIQLDKSYGEGCRVHDMIFEVMVSKSQESNFVSLVGRQYGRMPHGHGKIRRLSIHDNDHDEQRPKKVEQHHARHGFEAMKLQHVRSLTTFQCNYGIGKLLDRLGEFKLLRLLDLEGCEAVEDKHMRDVCRLYLLRFLSLRNTSVKVMPRKVGNLEHLVTLNVRHMRIRLPETVTRLSKLELLGSDGWLMRRGLGNMKALRELDTGVLDGDDVPWVTEEISELPRLQELSIRIKSNLQTHEFIQESLPKLAKSLSKTSTLQYLSLSSFESGCSLEFLLGVSTPPPLLQHLCLYGHISQLPDWISSLTHLTKFDIGCTELAGDQLFRVLCKLPNLQSIILNKIDWKNGELVAPSEHDSFPVLRTLKVSPCPTVLTFKEESMTKLEMLELDFRGMEEISIVGVKNLEKLKEVKLYGLKGTRSMESAVEQLHGEKGTRSIGKSSESKQIKVVANWFSHQTDQWNVKTENWLHSLNTTAFQC